MLALPSFYPMIDAIDLTLSDEELIEYFTTSLFNLLPSLLLRPWSGNIQLQRLSELLKKRCCEDILHP
jgi:hypothetical protein